MIQIIEAIICQERGLSPQSLHCKSRDTEVREPRQIIVHFARLKTTMSLYQIGSYFNLDHATVVHSVKAVNNMIDTDRDFKKRIGIYKAAIDQYTDNSLNDRMIAIAVLKVEIDNLKRQLSEKETILNHLQNLMK